MENVLDDPTKQALVGWGVVYVILLASAESSPETLGPIATAFAWLFATAVIAAVGPSWWQNIQYKISKGDLFASNTPTPIPGIGTPGSRQSRA